MPNCCGGASCACKLNEGGGIDISGTGTPADPFVIGADIGLSVIDTTKFNLTLTGTGTAANPWALTVDYAATHKLDDLPDVVAAAPTNGQVLGWDSATSKWTPRAPTTAASGSVSHDTSLTGDGSVGTPLAVNPNLARGVETVAGGFGLTDATMNSLVRRYADAAARAAAVPAPVLNSMSALGTAPGQVDYWDGTVWRPVKDGFDTVTVSDGFLQMSGSYNNTRLTRYIKAINDITDGSGQFDVLTVAELTGRGGVLSMQFTETGTDLLAPSHAGVTVYPNVDHVTGVALSLIDGTPVASLPITGLVEAWLY